MEDGDYCDVFPYDTDFDSLDESDKGIAMRHILDTLPSILKMKDWLTSHPGSRIRSMERISPAAESLLNWIVSSNRSCIFQVGGSQDAMSNLLPEPAGKARGREHEWIPGLDGWMQFRFAQGSPDKELRFNRALKEVAETKSLGAHPTILAWHGSNLANWHSIVRTGLDYQDIRSGRAYGHGVYFSRYFATSIGYTGSAQYWPNSDLKLINCLSLNEIINAPEKFVSKDPHYVVSQLDWHQCRYLFVQTSRTVKGPTKKPNAKTADSPALYPQAPGFEVYGPSNQILKIPLTAIPPRTIGGGGVKTLGPSKRPIQRLEDSDDEDAEDISLLLSDDEFNACRSPPGKKSASRASSLDTEVTRERCVIPCDPVLLKKLTHDHRGGARPPTPASVDRSLTDFEPGTLDLTTLPRLGAPSFATDAAGRVLSRELRKLQSIQAKTALHELGWYMDFDQVTNLFQWIVELHSFDPALPLAQDMKRTGITSIVVEVRFGANFPLSPPFVRVIRPRFLPFAMGGGGHVTAGGAMCMQLLTDSGWSPAYSMESVLLEVRLALCNPEPRPARLQNATQKNGAPLDYGVEEAIEAYIRAARSHNWKVPADLRQTASGV
jgi:ubiquitin-conjugating enzyme E2 Q